MIEVRLISEFPGDMLVRIAGLYISANWISPGDDTSFLYPALKGSALVAGAFQDGEIIGIGRAISDGCSDAYIQDVVVSPDHRGQGIGKKMFAHFLARTDKSHPITVNASDYGVPIYEKLGFSVTDSRKEENGIVYTPMTYRRERNEQ